MPTRPLVRTRWIVIRYDRRNGVEFYDWDTLSPSKDSALEKARKDDYRTGCGRTYPIRRVVQGEFIEVTEKGAVTPL